MRIRIPALILACLGLPYVQTTSFAQSQVYRHIFNVYASGSQDDDRVIELTSSKITHLERCGVAAISDHTYRYQGMAENMIVTISGPHATLALARAELLKAKACGVEGYTKRATFMGGE
jgi:hypothetical protein